MAAAIVIVCLVGYVVQVGGQAKGILASANPGEVPALLPTFALDRLIVNAWLRVEMWNLWRADDQSARRLNGSLALLPTDAGQLDYLVPTDEDYEGTRLLDLEYDQFLRVLPFLENHGERSAERLHDGAERAERQFHDLERQLQTDAQRLAKTAAVSDEVAQAQSALRTLADHREVLARRQVNAAIGLMRLGKADLVWPLLKHSPDPRVRSWLENRFARSGIPFATLEQRLKAEPDVTIRCALIRSLRGYTDVAGTDRDALLKTLLDLYRTDRDAGIHGAAEYVLRAWGQAQQVTDIDNRELAIDEARVTERVNAGFEWFVNRNEDTLVVLAPETLVRGTPLWEKDREPDERIRDTEGYRYAIANKETTNRQFGRFVEETKAPYEFMEHPQRRQISREDDSPMNYVSWFDAGRYCNWLSEKEGIPRDQWCFEEVDGIWRAVPNCWSRIGYRLPREEEWEHACRAGTTTSFCSGDSEILLGDYAWLPGNADGRMHPVATKKPNDLGLFDMHANALEWCVEEVELTGGELGIILRGGSIYSDGVRYVRSGCPNYNQPRGRYLNAGFRVARTLTP